MKCVRFKQRRHNFEHFRLAKCRTTETRRQTSKGNSRLLADDTNLKMPKAFALHLQVPVLTSMALYSPNEKRKAHSSGEAPQRTTCDHDTFTIWTTDTTTTGHSRRYREADDNRVKAVRPRQWRYPPFIYIHTRPGRSAGNKRTRALACSSHHRRFLVPRHSLVCKAMLRKKKRLQPHPAVAAPRQQKTPRHKWAVRLKQPHSFTDVVRTTHARFTCEQRTFFFFPCLSEATFNRTRKSC